jgi:LytR cell envelope-related transcriptional attenuator
MALPSAVTLGSLALIVAAGAGLGVITASAGEGSPATNTAATNPPHTFAPSKSDPGKKHKHHHRHHGRDPVPSTPVDIYNNSGIPDLAARKATYLSGAGWNVAGTDNWYGDIPADTVYYPPQMRRDAKHLAKALHIDRLHRSVEPMQFDRLTVILTGS